MKILIINFNLEGQTREEYDAVGIKAPSLITGAKTKSSF